MTRGLRIWLPPEVYLQRDLAQREAERWQTILGIRGRPGVFGESRRGLTVVETLFPESWRACPLWVGITWSTKTYPKMTGELMAADEGEAGEWLRRQTPKRTHVEGTGHIEFERRGVVHGTGVARAKRVLGF